MVDEVWKDIYWGLLGNLEGSGELVVGVLE